MSGLNKKAILTLVSNAAGYGPGHSAIVARGTVYTFEAVLGTAPKWYEAVNPVTYITGGFEGWLKHADGWLIMDVRKYLQKNTHRPVVVQELNDKVDFKKVMAYLSGSMASDNDYLGSGVCSSQVANAINAATSQSFNPTRVDTPMEVYKLAKKQGLVRRAYYYWPGELDVLTLTRAELILKMKADFADVPRASSDGIWNW